jgi:hypothetical protein
VVLEFEDAAAFAGEDEEGADPLVGDAENILIAEDDDVMMYSDGGAGKTTLGNDLDARSWPLRTRGQRGRAERTVDATGPSGRAT